MKLLVVSLLVLSLAPAALAASIDRAEGSPCDIGTAGQGGGTIRSGSCVPNSGTQSGFTALAPIPGLTDQSSTSVVNSTGFANFFNNLYKYLIGIAAVLAVIEIIWGGIEISTQDSISKNQDGKERIQQAVLGLVLILSPVIVFSIINPSILNLSISLHNLKTPPKNQVDTNNNQSSTGAAVASSTPTNDCAITGTLFKTAICRTQVAAQKFATSCSTGAGNVPFFTTDYKATCDTDRGAITGPYSFADTSSGFLATIFGYSKYEPIDKTTNIPNNGQSVLDFARTCTSDGGTTCMSAVKTPCASTVLNVIVGGSNQQSISTSCWNISLYCKASTSGVGGCDSNPQFTVVRTP